MSTPEEIKRASDYLRGNLAAELHDGTASFGHDQQVLLKFHGIYQQDDRDRRRALAAARQPLAYSCMVRAAVPGGRVSAEQWLALDRLAELTSGEPSLRLTTREGVQFHLVPKGSLHDVVAGVNGALLTTLAACGDVVRNTMACPAPLADGRQAVLQPALARLVQRFRPRTVSYWELWVGGEKAVSAEPAPPDTAVAGHSGDDVEPVYGKVYLPRKFKIGLAWPGDNCVDVQSQDLGLVPFEGGWQVLVGGGLGMSHSRPDDTYPRLASELAWVTDDQLLGVAEAVVTTQRDYGNRDDRHRARLKYLLDERGLGWFRAQVAERVGHDLAPPVVLPPWGTLDDHHGWWRTDAADWMLGVPVPSGRVRGPYRTAFRELVETGLVPELRVTPSQDLLLVGIRDEDRTRVEAVLRRHSIPLAEDVTPLRRLAIACPALPTCGQALGEAERVLPDVVDAIDAVSGSATLRLNMTGCPNGCARPYVAEVGIVGRTKTTYDVYLGGSPGGDRLARLLRAAVRLEDVAPLLAPVFDRWRDEVPDGSEAFGDWCHRVGVDALGVLLPPPVAGGRGRRAAAVAGGDG